MSISRVERKHMGVESEESGDLVWRLDEGVDFVNECLEAASVTANAWDDLADSEDREGGGAIVDEPRGEEDDEGGGQDLDPSGARAREGMLVYAEKECWGCIVVCAYCECDSPGSYLLEDVLMFSLYFTCSDEV
jgi:hypothetical protein